MGTWLIRVEYINILIHSNIVSTQKGKGERKMEQNTNTKVCPMIELTLVDNEQHGKTFGIRCTAVNCPYENYACAVPGNANDVFHIVRSE